MAKRPLVLGADPFAVDQRSVVTRQIANRTAATGRLAQLGVAPRDRAVRHDQVRARGRRASEYADAAGDAAQRREVQFLGPHDMGLLVGTEQVYPEQVFESRIGLCVTVVVGVALGSTQALSHVAHQRSARSGPHIRDAKVPAIVPVRSLVERAEPQQSQQWVAVAGLGVSRRERQFGFLQQREGRQADRERIFGTHRCPRCT